MAAPPTIISPAMRTQQQATSSSEAISHPRRSGRSIRNPRAYRQSPPKSISVKGTSASVSPLRWSSSFDMANTPASSSAQSLCTSSLSSR